MVSAKRSSALAVVLGLIIAALFCTATPSIAAAEGSDPQIVKSVESGTCTLDYRENGLLVIRPTDGVSGETVKSLRSQLDGFDEIKTILFEGEVTLVEGASFNNLGALESIECAEGAHVVLSGELDCPSGQGPVGMFQGCSALVDISGLSAWDVSSVTSMNEMFNGCSSLSEISALCSWDVSCVSGMCGMFTRCTLLSDISALKSWNVSSVENMPAMFYGCTSLADISALGGWDVSNVKDIASMFSDCTALSDVSALGGWDVSSVTYMVQMLSGCSKITDVSALGSWNISDDVQIYEMLEGCPIKKLSLSDTFVLPFGSGLPDVMWVSDDAENKGPCFTSDLENATARESYIGT